MTSVNRIKEYIQYYFPRTKGEVIYVYITFTNIIYPRNIITIDRSKVIEWHGVINYIELLKTLNERQQKECIKYILKLSVKYM